MTPLHSFVEAVMLFGMGLSLTREEDTELATVLKPCFAALALANDYFSFDKEWKEAQEPGAPRPLNAVWLNMQRNGVDIPIAKKLVRDAANRYETSFLKRCDNFRSTHAPISEKLDLYLRGMAYQLSGNVVWSLNCPRYHPEFRYDPNAGIEDVLTARYRGALAAQAEEGEEGLAEGGPPTALNHRHSIASTDSYFSESDLSASSWSRAGSRSSSISAASRYSDDSADQPTKIVLPAACERLGMEVSVYMFSSFIL